MKSYMATLKTVINVKKKLVSSLQLFPSSIIKWLLQFYGQK